MRTSTRNHLSCAVFGHNLEPFTNRFHDEKVINVFICSSCRAKMVMDDSGNFEELPYKNNHIAFALRKLFLLNSKTASRELSM